MGTKIRRTSIEHPEGPESSSILDQYTARSIDPQHEVAPHHQLRVKVPDWDVDIRWVYSDTPL